MNEKWLTVHLKTSKTAARSSIWSGQKCIWSYTQRLQSKNLLFFLLTNSWKSLKMHCNVDSTWIMRSPKKQAWCRGVLKWHYKNTYKTYDILHICLTCQENYVFRIQWLFTKISKSLFGFPRAPVERPETPRRAPWDHWMTSKWQQCMKNQWEITHFSRLMSIFRQNHAKHKKNKKCQRFPLYFMFVWCMELQISHSP